MSTYTYGVPGTVIYLFHIFVGLYLFYLGFKLTQNQKLADYNKYILITLGSVAILYQSWLWYRFPKRKYSLGLSGWMVHLFHIALGILLIYIGLSAKNNSKGLNAFLGAILIALGALGSTYMTHLMYMRS